MINKIVNSRAEAVQDIYDGATIMIGGFGEAGSPVELIHALIDHGAKNLTVVSNNTGSGYVGLAALIANKQVKKMICCFSFTQISCVGLCTTECLVHLIFRMKVRVFYFPLSHTTTWYKKCGLDYWNFIDYVHEIASNVTTEKQ